jgi:tetratricopeptide (TPR) repeat protein
VGLFPRLSSLFLGVLLASSARGAPTVVRPEIRLDPRVELGAALHLLASRAAPLAGFRDDGSAYARALMDGLADRGGHPAVAAYARAFRRPAPGGQAFMTPLRELVLCLDDGLALRMEKEDCRGSALAHAAAAFATETGFARRIPALEALVEPSVAALRRAREGADLVGYYERYSGLPASNQRVAPSPLLGRGRFWNDIERPSAGGYWVVTVISPVSVSSAGPVFDWRPVMRDVWHEHSHGIMDPAEDALAPAIDAASGLFAGKAAAECYGSWRQCVREHLAQGISYRLVVKSEATGAVKAGADPVLNPHLPWEALIAARLAEYEGDRNRYPTLTSFTPRLISVFTEEAARLGVKPRPAAVASAPAPDPDVERGMALFAAGRSTEAAESFEAAVRRSSGSAVDYLSLFVALQASGRPAEAESALERAVGLARADAQASPDVLADALSSRASVRAQRGDAAGAKKDLNEALAAAPEDWPRRDDARARLNALR